METIYISQGMVRCGLCDRIIPHGVRYIRTHAVSLTGNRIIPYNACEVCIPVERSTEPIEIKEMQDEYIG